MGRQRTPIATSRAGLGSASIVALVLAWPVAAQARQDGGASAGGAGSRSAQVQEMRLQMREYRKSWLLPRPAAVGTDGMPASMLPSRPARTRLSDSERDLLRRELRDLRIKPAP